VPSFRHGLDLGIPYVRGKFSVDRDHRATEIALAIILNAWLRRGMHPGPESMHSAPACPLTPAGTARPLLMRARLIALLRLALDALLDYGIAAVKSPERPPAGPGRARAGSGAGVVRPY
jgi:hypothetical protein